MPWFFPDDEEVHDGWSTSGILVPPTFEPYLGNIFEGFASRVTTLRMQANQIRLIPVRVLNNLLDLEIFCVIGDEEEIVGLDLIFYHATLLRSLTLIGYLIPPLFSLLPAASTGVLPHLSSFRISGAAERDDDLEGVHVGMLLHFLQGRIVLRRLYIRLPNLYWPDIRDVWSTAKALPNIEVLGLHAGFDHVSEYNLQELINGLPDKICALHLAFNCDQSHLLALVCPTSCRIELLLY